MQSLKDLELMISTEKPTLTFFFKRGHMSIMSLEQEHQKTKSWDIHDLLDIISNCTQLQLNRIRTYNFQLKLFDTAVTLKYNQGY